MNTRDKIALVDAALWLVIGFVIYALILPFIR